MSACSPRVQQVKKASKNRTKVFVYRQGQGAGSPAGKQAQDLLTDKVYDGAPPVCLLLAAAAWGRPISSSRHRVQHRVLLEVQRLPGQQCFVRGAAQGPAGRAVRFPQPDPGPVLHPRMQAQNPRQAPTLDHYWVYSISAALSCVSLQDNAAKWQLKF